jgi:hypothetical protein
VKLLKSRNLLRVDTRPIRIVSPGEAALTAEPAAESLPIAG